MRSFSFPEGVLVLFAIAIGFYFLFLGYVLARLWFYQGALGPQPKRYVILPQYLKEVLQREREMRKAHGELDPSRWTGDFELDPNTNPDDVSDEKMKKELLEQKRISRMPAFVQDDCGDGSLFPDVPVINPSVYESLQPLERLRPLEPPAFRENPGKYMTMGLVKLDMDEWLTVDNTYQKFYDARAKLLDRKRAEVLQVLPEAEEACEELMWEVVEFLTKKYPELFEVYEIYPGKPVIKNKCVGEEFRLHRPWERHPLEICARLAMEDFNVLARSEFTGQHRLIASATLFPAGWRLRERLGKSITDLHGPVPLWEDLPDILNSSYFARLSDKSCMERHTFFIQTHPDNRPLDKLLFIQEGKDFFPGKFHNMRADDIVVRRERQTFRRLPKSEAIIFTVKTSVQRLTEVAEGERKGLATEIKAWPSQVAHYKGRDLWQKTVFGFCEGKKKELVKEDEDEGSNVGDATDVGQK